MTLTVLLILFVLIGSVSAAKDNTTTLSKDTSKEINQKISIGNDDSNLNKEILKSNDKNTTLKEPVSGDSFSDIQTAINNANPGEIIELSGLYKGSGTEITISKNNLTIIGNDATLDGQGLSRIFNITGNKITLKNIQFINGYTSENGGAINWDGENGTVENSTFTNNTAYIGGAINWNGANGSVENSTFTNNTAQWGGGAINWNEENGKINRSNFNNNKANTGGVLYWGGENGSINNSNFKNNTAEDGGAIYLEGSYGTVRNCNFINNQATEEGGAILWYGDNGKITYCNFTNNTAQDEGGAINWFYYEGTLSNCNFNNNTANLGGAISWEADSGIISNSTFKGNKAENYRNIYLSSGDLILFNSTLESIVTISQVPDCDVGSNSIINITFDDGSNLENYNVTFFNNNELIKTFAYNSTYNYTYNWNNLAAGNYSITVGDINNNQNKYPADYEAMKFKVTAPMGEFEQLQKLIDNASENSIINLEHNYTYTINLDTIRQGILINKNLTVNGNGFTIDAKGSSRIFQITGAGITLKNIKFINAYTTESGGAISWSGENGTINQCTFNNNTAEDEGGAINWNGVNGVVSNCNFNNNNATSFNGGAINWNGENGTINQCTFNNNTAEYEGGAIYWAEPNGTVNNCKFDKNTAYIGGAIEWIGEKGTITNCTFTNNKAYDGGAIDLMGEKGTITNSTFTKNNATGNGGAINWEYSNKGNISRCNFTNNTAQEDGGAIYWTGNNSTLSDSIFKANKAMNYRNIYSQNNILNLFNCSLETIITISQIPDCIFGSSATINLTFDDGTHFEGYNVTLYNNNELIKTFEYNNTYNYTYTMDNLAAGEYTITVGYTNNNKNKYIANYEAMKFTVTKYTSSVSIEPINNVTYNSEVIVDFHVENRTSITIIVTNLQTGEKLTFKNFTGSEFRINNIIAGEYNITITNSENENYSSSNASALFNIAKAKLNPADINITVTPGKGDATISITAPKDFNGNINVIINGTSYPVSVVNGNASKIIPLAPGKYNLTGANITENQIYNDTIIPQNISFEVEKLDPQHIYSIIDNKDMSVFYMEGALFTVRIVDENKNPVCGKTVTFKVNGKEYTADSDANGYASIPIEWKPGKSTITATCENTTVFNSIQVKSVIHSTKNVKVKKSKNTKFKVALWGLKAKIVKKPAFKYNGKTKVPVKIGKDLAGKKVSVKFKGEYFTTKVDLKGNGVLKISKKLAHDLKLKKGKKYKGRVVYKDMVIYKNTPLNVKIDGKTYTVKTNKKGETVFKITKKMVKNLKVGKKYPYYVEFGENTAKGNLVIKK